MLKFMGGLRYTLRMNLDIVMVHELCRLVEQQDREIKHLRAHLAAWKAFGEFLLDDAEEPADLHSLGSRIRTDVPRLQRGEIGPDGETLIA